MTPRTPELSEEAKKENSLANQQKIIKDIHEKLVYDTIEQRLPNLIDIEADGKHETKEMKIIPKKHVIYTSSALNGS